MRACEFVIEGRDSPLYHVIGEKKAATIFAHDSMPANWQHNIPGAGRVAGNSFSRNKMFNMFHNAGEFGWVCRLVVDQAKLAQTHKIIPIAAATIYNMGSHNAHMPPEHKKDINQYLKSYPGHKERGNPKYDKYDQSSEEFVIGDIDQLHKYITRIDIWSDVSSTEDKGMFLSHLFSYAEEFGIPVNVSPEAKASVNRLLAKWNKLKKKPKTPQHPNPRDQEQYWDKWFNSKRT